MHSSKHIATSEPRTRCVSIDSRGPRKTREPSMWELNSTPSSRILRRCPREKTWKPPLSVRIGPSQPMKRCKPPQAATMSLPGRSIRWYVLARIIPTRSSCRSLGSRVLTVACVPTGMKAGVWTTPCVVASAPRRAA